MYQGRNLVYRAQIKKKSMLSSKPEIYVEDYR